MRRASGSAVLAVSFLIGCGQGNDDASTDSVAELSKGQCAVVFGFTDSTRFSSMDVRVDYTAAPGHFVGHRDSVECRRLLHGFALGLNNGCASDDCASADRYFIITFDSGNEALRGPADVIACTFDAKAEPSADDFRVEILDASVFPVEPVFPPPGFGVTRIACAENATTTTTPSSTTSTIPSCDGVSCVDGEHCEAGMCTAGGLFTVEVSALDDVLLGALQVDMSYDCGLGDFVGSGFWTACHAVATLPVSAAFNDRAPETCDPLGRMTASLISLDGFSGPAPLFSCVFTAADGVVPSPADFDVVVVESTSPSIQPVSVRVGVSSVTRR